MNSKNTLLILGAFCLLAGSVSAFQLHSSLVDVDRPSTSLLSHTIQSTLVSDGPSIIEVEPFKPNQSPPISVENSALSNQVDGSSRGSGLSVWELEKVLGTTRVYDTTSRKWLVRPWTPSQRENIVMSWTHRGDQLGVKRPSAGRLYYNKMEATK